MNFLLVTSNFLTSLATLQLVTVDFSRVLCTQECSFLCERLMMKLEQAEPPSCSGCTTDLCGPAYVRRECPAVGLHRHCVKDLHLHSSVRCSRIHRSANSWKIVTDSGWWWDLVLMQLEHKVWMELSVGQSDKHYLKAKHTLLHGDWKHSRKQRSD